MTTLAPTRSDRITVRRRADLDAVPVEHGDGIEWVVKDPLSMRFFRLAEHEYYLLNRLDGRIGVEELRRDYHAAYAPRTITRRQLARFLTMVLQGGLVTVEESGRGRFLQRKSLQRRRAERRSRWSGIPSMRFRGVDPSHLLDRLSPLGRVAFSRQGLAIFGLSAVWALAIAVSECDRLVRELDRAASDMQFAGAALVVVAVFGMKVVHELAHGLACKRFGGQCRELGLIWVLYTPLLYCDVSDAWIFRKRRHRVLVAAAGILAETFVATLALVGWRYTPPGPLHDVCLFVGVIALVNTVLVNGNPLMRFDGYFALCDLIGVSNLSERSSRAVRRFFASLRPTAATTARTTSPKIGYVAYGLASMGYRVLVLAGLYLFLIRLGQAYEISWAAWLFVLWMVAAAAARSVGRNPRRSGETAPTIAVRTGRWMAAIAAIVVVLFVPVPRSITGPLVVESAIREPAHAAASGRLLRIGAPYGATVRPGELLAEFESPELEAEVARKNGELLGRKARLKHLNRARFDDPVAAAAIPRFEEACRSLEGELAILLAERSRLTVTARAGGTFVPPAAVLQYARPGELAGWSGRPLDERNLGAQVEPGVLLGEVASTDAWRPVVVIEDGDAARLHVGDHAAISLESRTECLTGVIESITPESVTATGGQGIRPPPAGAMSVPRTVRYRICIRPAGDARLCAGQNGEARLSLPAECLYKQIIRQLSRTFSG